MVMPLACSSGRESIYRILPANFGEMMPFVASKASVNEVLPWSYDAVSAICFFLFKLLRLGLCEGLKLEVL